MWAKSLQEAANFIREQDDFLVVSHVQPDGDAISSTVAMGWLLKQLGKSYTMLNEGVVPSRLHYLWSSADIKSVELHQAEQKYKTIICVDCADFARVGKATEWFADDVRLLNIDHHPTNDSYGQVNLLKFHAAATAEIIFELIDEIGCALDVQVATALYTGMLTDTGGFRYSSTTSQVMAMSSRLIAAGVNGPELAELLLERMTMGQMRMIQRGLSRLSFSANQQIGWLWVTSEDLTETGASNEDLEGLVNYPRNIEGVEVGILFKQNGQQSVKVSLRSAGAVNVAAVAQTFGGGGHVRAAGCRLTVPLEAAIEQVVSVVQNALDAQHV
ncbi:MAG: bifunctional oligoribonuclease/PAP phosphatase NrnA [Candidatus Cohnella colombiensis]|uniref:Bifunctional oligoribonuclease/PAP phosphatase NrnA n=1 Tax=Candidatus Cohnella colombiensis TaxID=3121368 RepID=A0AA95EZ17_9BACL|nr:MAG: bifunctional oligoribonuclease/PAP phosphatase NrnA [Cohnella sp.]